LVGNPSLIGFQTLIDSHPWSMIGWKPIIDWIPNID